MDKRVLTFCVVAVSGLAACSTYDPYYGSTPTNPPASAAVVTTPSAVTTVTPAPMAVTTPVTATAAPGTVAYRAGYGVIESISLVYQPRTPSSSAGASTSNSPDPGPYRMTVRMDDSSLQSLVVDNRSFMVGDRVQLMNDGRVARL